MKEVKKIAVINLLILLAYSLIIRIINGGGGTHNDEGIGILFLSAIAVSLHVFVCLVIMAFHYFDKNNNMGKAWLLSAGIVLLVGFSTCLGNAML